jgi:hypothetical protein
VFFEKMRQEALLVGSRRIPLKPLVNVKDFGGEVVDRTHYGHDFSVETAGQ